MSNEARKKIRLDQLLVERGLAPTLTKAQALILAGAITCPQHIQLKPGLAVPIDIELSVLNPCPYVSRGGLKLAGALRDLQMHVQGWLCLDLGASSGGFVDCLLQHGAKHVFCLDVGRAQLHDKLRQHPQVTWRESLHVKDLNAQSFSPHELGPQFDLVTIDVSFISLTKILVHTLPWLRPQGLVLALVKPQFELGPKDAPKGVVKSPAKRQEALSQVLAQAQNLKFELLGQVDSELKGPKGNQESFVLLRKSS